MVIKFIGLILQIENGDYIYNRQPTAEKFAQYFQMFVGMVQLETQKRLVLTRVTSVTGTTLTCKLSNFPNYFNAER